MSKLLEIFGKAVTVNTADLIWYWLNAIKGGDDDIVPVVALESTSYAHKEYGKINTPILAIDHWTSMDGGTADEVKDEPEPEAPTKRRRIAG